MDPINKNSEKNEDQESSMQNDDLIINGPADDQAAKKIEIPVTQAQLNENQPKVTTKKTVLGGPDLFELKPETTNRKSVQKVIKTEEVKPRPVFKEQRSLAGLVFKMFFIAVLSGVIFGLSVFFGNLYNLNQVSAYSNSVFVGIPAGQNLRIIVNGQETIVNENFELKGGEIIKTDTSIGIFINLPENGVLRLDQNTEAQINQIDPEKNEHVITLVQGKIWGNLLNNFFDLKLNSGKIVVVPSNSSFEIIYDGSRTNIYVAKHDLLVNIIAGDKTINKMWIAEGNQAQFLNTKIEQEAETIEQLLYSKLIKEFNYGRTSATTLANNEWAVKNIQEDQKLKSSIESAFIKKVRDEGLKNLSTDSLRYQAKEVVSDLRSALTFSDDKKITAYVKDVFENIDDAAFLFIKGNKVDAQVRLSLFLEDLKDSMFITDQYAAASLYKKLWEYLADYLFIGPDDDLYPIKTLLFNQVFISKQRSDLTVSEQYNLLTLKLNDIYDALAGEGKDLDTKLKEYFDDYEILTSKFRKNISEIKDEIIKQLILVDNILLQYPQSYKLFVFESKKQIEEDYLLALSSQRDKQEQRQTFINEKINILAKIQTFLFDEQLDPADARQVVFRLITDIEELQKQTIGAAAVNQLFEERLKNFGLFWEYLKSDEYSTTPLHGKTHLERFEEFKKIQEKNLSYEDIRNEILGSKEEVQITPEEILGNVRNALTEAGFENVEFGSYTDSKKTKVPILNAQVSGIDFRATYDWDRQLLGDIIVNDKLISKDGVKITKAKTLILETIASETAAVTQPETQTPVETPQSEYDSIFKAAKVFLIGKLKTAGIELTEENIRVVDLSGGVYRISNVFYTKRKDIKFSFDYLTKDEKVTNVSIQTKIGEIPVNNTFELVFLDDVVYKIYDDNLEK